MNIPETIKQSIEVLSDKFGATGQHLYELLVKSTFIDGIVTVSFGVIILVIAGIIYKKLGTENYDNYFIPPITWCVVLTILGAFLIAISIQSIFLPEAVLIKSLFY